MAIYTGVADANGDFNIPFSENYTGGQKVTVTAEKDSETKSIELFAPSDVVGGGLIQFSGTFNNFPMEIGNVVLNQISGEIPAYSFSSGENSGVLWRKATGLTIPEGVTSIGHYCFGSWTNAISLTLPSTLTSIGNEAFSLWSSALSLTIPPLVTDISTGAFRNWTSAEALVIPDAVTFIGQYAFARWESSTSLIIGSGVSIILSYSFQNWYACNNLVIPNSVEKINSNAFTGWSAAELVDIGSGITSIGATAFRDLTSCDEIIIRATTPPTIQANTFQNLKAGCVIKVPSSSLIAYQTATNWSAFASQMVGF